MNHEALPYELLLAAIALRTIIVLLVLISAFRVLGRREFGQFDAFDLATLMCISNAVQNAMTEGRGELGVALCSSAALILTGAVLERLSRRHPRLARDLEGAPAVLVSRGKVIVRNLEREGVRREDVDAALRRHGLEDPSKAELAVLELDGTISIVPWKRRT